MRAPASGQISGTHQTDFRSAPWPTTISIARTLWAFVVPRVITASAFFFITAIVFGHF